MNDQFSTKSEDSVCLPVETLETVAGGYVIAQMGHRAEVMERMKNFAAMSWYHHLTHRMGRDF